MLAASGRSGAAADSDADVSTSGAAVQFEASTPFEKLVLDQTMLLAALLGDFNFLAEAGAAGEDQELGGTVEPASSTAAAVPESVSGEQKQNGSCGAASAAGVCRAPDVDEQGERQDGAFDFAAVERRVYEALQSAYSSVAAS